MPLKFVRDSVWRSGGLTAPLFAAAPAGEQCGKGTVEFFFAVDNGADTRGHVIREDRAVRTSVDGRAENAGNGFAVPAGGTDGGSASRGGQFPRDSGQAFAGVGVVGEYLCGGGCIFDRV